MVYLETEARRLVVQAGKQLVESGLIARTWGNISARISNTQFVITPSGMAYETLLPEQIVTVNIDDCSYDGNIKPSSEKGIHADVYRLRPEANFVIHTHQTKASVMSIMGRDLTEYSLESSEIFGTCIPCAEYGISSTKTLRKAVAKAVSSNPKSQAILLRNHGVLCIGSDYLYAFVIARTLETVCANAIEAIVLRKSALPKYSDELRRSWYLHSIVKNQVNPPPCPDLGNSWRNRNLFTLEYEQKIYHFDLNALPTNLFKVAAIHAKIYQSSRVSHIIHVTDPEVLTVSRTGKTMNPSIDDLAQIAGINIRCSDESSVARKLKNRNAVFVRNSGALCTGNTALDAEACGMVLKKGCEAEIFSVFLPKQNQLGLFDALIQRTFYVLKYSKLKK
ncbi:MAG: class II aldolase/adducin family protein [Candidatus Izemoplasmatales bacterium]|jgi:L-fuculose-phosphate aldolase|nr:class II aldolase/adducin family protein [Candidatus Izemoplasmatales bacterium]MDD4595887.1 class II aldolase/adducin family protein [Candidatus Izemoplasmatales bacterium]